MFFLYDGDDNIIGMNYEGEFYYYQKNVLGDVTAVYDANGVCVAEYEYDAWGNVIYQSGGQNENQGIDYINPIRYRSYYYENSVGMYYLQSRYYYATAGRFINADDPQIALETKEETDGTNLFAYCCNDPVNNTDPTGYAKKHTITVRFYMYYKYKKINGKKIKVYPNPFGHIDISFSGKTYMYGNYSYNGDGVNYRVAVEKGYISYMKKNRTISSVKLKLTSKEFKKLKKFYSKYKKTDMSKESTQSKQFTGRRYNIKKGMFKQYNLYYANCSTFTFYALKAAMPKKVIAISAAHKIVYNNINCTPRVVFSIVKSLKKVCK